MGLVFALLIWWTPRVGDNGSFPLYYYVVIISMFLVHQVSSVLVRHSCVKGLAVR